MVFLLVLLAVTGCSRVSILYRTADLFIEQYADDYLSLDRSQSASWNPTLAIVLARHRRDELPTLGGLFRWFHRAVRKGLEATDMTCLLDAFKDLYHRHFRLAAELAAPLLATLSLQQIRALERKFAKNAKAEAKRSRFPLGRRLRKRAKRWSESAT